MVLGSAGDALRSVVDVGDGELKFGNGFSAKVIFGIEADLVAAHTVVIRQAAEDACGRIECQPRWCVDPEAEAVTDQAVVIAEEGGQLEADAFAFTDAHVLEGFTHQIGPPVEELVHHLDFQAGAGGLSILIGGDQLNGVGTRGVIGCCAEHPTGAGIDPEPAGEIGVVILLDGVAVAELIALIDIAEELARQGDVEVFVFAQIGERQLGAAPDRRIVDVVDRELDRLAGRFAAEVCGFHLQVPAAHLVIGGGTAQPA